MSVFTGSTQNIVVRYWVKQITPPVASRYISAHIHPIRPKVVHMSAHRPKDTLWWRVSVNKILPERRVVRSWCARRVRTAFAQAMRQHGFDEVGRLLPGSSEGQGNLTGTLEIFIHPPCVVQSYEVVQKDASQLLSEVMAHRAAQISTPKDASTKNASTKS
ncbi:hypothetical protein N7541_011307 [Penicillium brevicompactum]|uniref:Uncharacterized protein n=1 Tax=Penicillium brevicompactum TaxID=5074 RepID=A0A9W9UIA1_PENBR|nr:uncharacterized protein N7506_008958 [Penicillium brevicompactum]KAJ5325856.1 hypothetical protein N7506_008958 [Penicillium brevicompactum]KAJ5342183.1 hypothetical protein N7541_011307 [Penicillium brevicompactum]